MPEIHNTLYNKWNVINGDGNREHATVKYGEQLYATTVNNINDVLLKLTAMVSWAYLDNNLPEQTNHNERRRQRRFVFILVDEAVTR